MRTTLAAVAASLAVTAALGAQPVITAASVLLRDSDVKWGDPPPALEKGASFALISGDPTTGGPYVIRLKMPAGYKVAPHWHPTAENITVISGTFALGMGEKFDPAALKDFGPGSYGLMPAEMRHFAECVRDGRTPRETYDDGYAVSCILDAGYASAKSKRWVTVRY